MAFQYVAKLFRRYGPVLTTGSVLTLWREARHQKAHGSDPQRVVRVRLAHRPFSQVSLRPDSDDPYTLVEMFHDAVYQPALDALGECRSIIDLGSNIGLSCLYFADRCPEAKIFALEPYPSNYRLLQINTAPLLRSGVCRTLQAAFWRDEDTNLSFCLPKESSSADVFLAPASGTPAGECVRGLTMNSILAESGFQQVDLLKVDIEGAEADLFHGRNEWLQRVRAIAVEFHGDARRESGFDSTMRDFGFRIADEGQHTVLAIRTPATAPARMRGTSMECEGSDISVVIPYHNREQYIDETIQSVLAQTLQPLEIIIVNDCSRESSRRYLDRYAEACTIIDLPTNMGLAVARNTGIRRARGQFIAFLDDDDIWLPDKLERQLRYLLDHPRCDAVHGAAWAFFTDRPDHLCKRDWPGPLTLAQALKLEDWVMHPTMLIRTDVVRAVGGYDPRFRRSQDGEFQIRCAAAGYRIESIREPLARFRRQGHESTTKHNWRMLRAYLHLCWKHKSLYYRVYGVRGVVSFLLASLELETKTVHYVGGAVRLLVWLIPVKWEVRRDYEEPVQQDVSPLGHPPAMRAKG